VKYFSASRVRFKEQNYSLGEFDHRALFPGGEKGKDVRVQCNNIQTF
jgi:hypothetical protein